MSQRACPSLAAFLVALATLTFLALRRPTLGAGLRWQLESIVHPPGAGARPLQ